MHREIKKKPEENPCENEEKIISKDGKKVTVNSKDMNQMKEKETKNYVQIIHFQRKTIKNKLKLNNVETSPILTI